MRGALAGATVATVLLALGGPPASSAPNFPPVAGRCDFGIGVFLQPPGRLLVYAYRLAAGTPTNTFQAVAEATPTTGGVFCHRVRVVRPLRARALVGPWPRQIESRVFCGGGGNIQVQSIIRARRIVGTRLLVLRGRRPIVDASLQKHGGAISFDPYACVRNEFP
jgi:hypothetical protein